MRRSWLLGLVGLVWLGWSSGACAAPAPVYAPCVTVTSAKSGVVQEYCVPVSAANPLPITSQSGSLVATPVVTGTQWYPVFGGGAPTFTVTLAPVQNLARCAPFNWPWASHVDRASITVSTAGTGPLNFALYSDAVDAVTNQHQPQTLLTDPSLAFAVGATGTPTVTLGAAGVGIALPKGLSWACVNDGVAADAVRYIGIVPTSGLLTSLVGASAAIASGNNQLSSLTFAVNAGTTTANWPSLAGQTMAAVATQPPLPFFALEVATVP